MTRLSGLSYGGSSLAKGAWLEMAHEAEQAKYARKLAKLKSQLAELQLVAPHDDGDVEAWVELENELVDRIERLYDLLD